MGPFIIIALIILLILIVISVFAYPFICASIAVACKRYDKTATGILLLLTIALYIYACTTLEHSFDNWCYSVYAGIVLTPLFLYACTGIEEPQNWPENGGKIQHCQKTIPLITCFTSSLFTIEGAMRMAHSYSIHKMLNSGWVASETDTYRFYYEEFQYAGSLLFFVSLFSALVIGINFIGSYKEYKHKLSVDAVTKSRIKREVNSVTQKLKFDLDLLMSFESQQVDKSILYYNTFCQKIVAALESSDEKTNLSYEYSSFTNIDTSYKVLLLSNINRSFYFYPVGIVTRDSNDTYNYLPNGSDTVSVNIIKKNKRDALPSEIRPIRQGWQHTCHDGSPDLRYKYNPKTYVYEYAFLRITELILHVYRLDTGKDVMNAYNKMYSYISQLKQQNNNEDMNALPEEKAIISSNDNEKKLIVTKAEQSEETKTAKQNVAIDNPKTLEECFSVTILKRGTDILKDGKLVDLISSCKDVDISEYKDVLEGMVSDDFLYQFTEPGKQNDFALYNLCSSFARQNKVNAQKVLFITQALVTAIKKSYNNTQKYKYNDENLYKNYHM